MAGPGLSLALLIQRSRNPVCRSTALRTRRRSRPLSVRPAPSSTDDDRAWRRAATTCGGTISSPSSSSSSALLLPPPPPRPSSPARRSPAAFPGHGAGTRTGADCLGAALGATALTGTCTGTATPPPPPLSASRDDSPKLCGTACARRLAACGADAGGVAHPSCCPPPAGHTTSRSSSSNGAAASGPADSGCFRRPRKRSEPAPGALGIAIGWRAAANGGSQELDPSADPTRSIGRADRSCSGGRLWGRLRLRPNDEVVVLGLDCCFVVGWKRTEEGERDCVSEWAKDGDDVSSVIAWAHSTKGSRESPGRCSGIPVLISCSIVSSTVIISDSGPACNELV
ncbi:hypothetical protein BDA96_01G570600 [Sorghum bicolor]|uniref:Uncharacterized protein n=1 Tax=Sorghum bicolor TaxID=4558 RepID=A0A921S780_SORBI|nr:hypothetical protein BDA96_01G570600 [Sorghum bicolor]